MRTLVGWVGGLAAALSIAAESAGEEPIRPTASATEAKPAVPAAGHSIHSEAFNDGPRRSAALLPGMGTVPFPVTTSKPDAQAFVNQGVGQLHSFYYFEAERSFRQAAKIDPDCAMTYWGMAMANVNNAKRARGFLAESRKRAATLSRRETLYLEALEAFYKGGADDKVRRQGLLLGLEAAVQEFPADLDARAWLAMVTWQNSTRDGIGSRKAVDLVLESVLQAEPMHPGAHHYRIHLWNGDKSIRAQSSAALYAETAPGIAHAWHMPGHTYTDLKRYADAAYQQEGSARVDHAAMVRDRIMPFQIFNYAHNNQWLATSYSHIGRVRDAVAVAQNLVEQPRDPDQNGKNDGGSAQRNGRLRWGEVLVRYELWDDLIAADTSGALDWSDLPLERRTRAYNLGLAFAARGDSARLEKQVAALKALAVGEGKAGAKGVPKQAAPKYSWEAASPDIKAAIAELEGYQLLAKGDVGPAFDRFAKATTMRPEALARAHLSARNFGLAESVVEEAVAKNPDQFPPLAAAVEILHAVGKIKEAQDAYRKLVPLARSADPNLPVLQRLAAIMTGWKTDGISPASDVQPATDDATIHRIDLSTLGPLTWAPYAAEPFTITDLQGKPWSLADHKGRNVVLLFFLGGKCAHCMQQLQVFGKEIEALKALNTDLVALSTDDLDATKTLQANPDGIKFSMPLLPDPRLDIFKSYHAFDDFEGVPLHGTFLIDAKGSIRYQRISADPFLDADFIKTEAARIHRIVKP